MANPNINLFNRTKLKFASKILPFKAPEVSKLDYLDLELPQTKINRIKIPSISFPELSANCCLERKDSIELDSSLAYIVKNCCKNHECDNKFFVRIDGNFFGQRVRITCPKCDQDFISEVSENYITNDLSAWITEQLIIPKIESFSLLFKKPRRAGKTFIKDEAIEQDELFTSEEGRKDCIHGLKKSWCSICTEKEKQEKETKSLKVDPFDLILPILQPPLGDNFDSTIAFPQALYDFQRSGVRFLVDHEEALLGDEMGLGKTIQAISATRFLFRLGKIDSCLILCPRSVLSTWEKELWDWAPELRLIKVRGTIEQREIAWDCPSHVYLTTYETFRQDLLSNEDKAKKDFGLVILDEIQKIKNPKADVTKAARRIEAKIRWGLSGTPLENRIEELVSIFAFIKPGLLTYADAKKTWKVKKTIGPYFLRRRKADALPELPDKVHEEKWLELTQSQRETYDLAEMEGIIALDEGGDLVTVQHIFALITKLKQICNIDPVSKESCKLEYLTEALEEISEQGDKALIFSQYPEKTLKLIEPNLKKYDPLVYHGALSDNQRNQKVRKFQENDENIILLMSVRAGGLGITLTRACYVFHYDFWWNPSVAAQAEDRAHRIGQKKTVFVTSLFTKDTIEERIQQVLKRKRELFKEVIDDLSDTNLSKVLSEDDLFSLFGLKKPEKEKQKKIDKDEFKFDRTFESVSPIDFEDLISRIYAKMGFNVRQTPQSRDKGVDVYAKRISEAGTESLAIQCKHYPKGVVGVEHARALYGVIQSQQSITKGVLVTSGRFSSDCKDFAYGKRLELFDRAHIIGLIEKYKVRFEKDENL